MLDSPDQRRDERGAILVLGIMLGAFLVGALFYVVGVGHAVIWRESVQAAADATAYEATAWNARGMNVIVAINIFMAIIMGVLVAWRLALFFVSVLTILAAIACAVSWIPGLQVLAPACGAAGWAGRLWGRMLSRNFQIENKVYKILGVLEKGHVLVASAGPILSIARSSIANSSRPNVNVAVALSSQLFPAPALTALAAAASTPIDPLGASTHALEGSGGVRAGGRPNNGNNGAGNNNNNNNNGNKPATCKNNNNNNRGKGKGKKYKQRKSRNLFGKPFSLNVQESDDISKLCDKAIDKQADAFLVLAKESVGVDGAGDAGNSGVFGDLLRWISKGLKGILCFSVGSPGSGMTPEEFSNKQAKEQCKNKDLSDTYEDKTKDGETAQEACERDWKEKAKEGEKHAPKRSGYRKSSVMQDPMWADVFGPFANGNMFAQTWAFVRADPQHSRIDKAIEIAGSFGGGTTTLDNSDTTVFAQSELYYDCDKDWDACYDQASWTMNWRARLRRVHSPLETAATSVEQTLSNQFTTILNQDPVQKVLSGTPLQDFLSNPSGSLLPDFFKGPFEDVREEMANQGGEAAQWVTDQGRDRATIIH